MEGDWMIYIDEERYFNLIDKDYLEAISTISSDEDLQKDFKLAYLALFYHLSRDGKAEEEILLGDLFISILTRRLICKNRRLLSKVYSSISSCHCENILWKIKCYKRELLKLMEEVTYAD